MILHNEHNIKQLLQSQVVIEERQPVFLSGKDLLQPLKSVVPVSETIKKYIEEQFAVLNDVKLNSAVDSILSE